MNITQKEIIEIMERLGACKEVATFITAQATLETGNFKSKIYIKNNNLFGMKLAKTRLTTATTEQYDHAYYGKRYESVIDYMLWLVYNGFTQSTIQDLQKFKLRLVNSGYCPLKDYIKRIEQIHEQIKIEQQ